MEEERRVQTGYKLVHANVAHARAPLDDDIMMGFTAMVDEINRLASRAPGFISEPTLSDEGTVYQPPFLLNVSLWNSIRNLKEFVYQGKHAMALEHREQWFFQDEFNNYVLYWIPQGQYPTEREVKERLDSLRRNGPTAYAFTFKYPFSATGEALRSV